ncbi:hypothetical protein IAR50_001154 [Cryptococcus sp. DSM 104548]
MFPQAMPGFFSSLSRESLKAGDKSTKYHILNPILAKTETIYETAPIGFILTSVAYGAEGDKSRLVIEVCSPRTFYPSNKDRRDALVIQRILTLVANNADASAAEEGKGIYRAARQAKQAVHRTIKELHAVIGKAAYFRFAHIHFRSFDKFEEAKRTTKPYIPQGQSESSSCQQASEKIMGELRSTREALERDLTKQKQRRVMFAVQKRMLDMSFSEDVERTARWARRTSVGSYLPSGSYYSSLPSYTSQSYIC